MASKKQEKITRDDLFKYECAYINAYRKQLKDVLHPQMTCFGGIPFKDNNQTFPLKSGDKLTALDNRERNRLLTDLFIFPNSTKKLYAFTTRSGFNIKGLNEDTYNHPGIIIMNNDADRNFYKRMFWISEYFNQDCFFYKPANCEIGYIIGTNGHDSKPLYGQKQEITKNIDMIPILDYIGEHIKNRVQPFDENNEIVPWGRMAIAFAITEACNTFIAK